MTTHKIKVNRMFYSRTIKDKHHYVFDRGVEEPVPLVQMKGKWLEKAGFSINTPIKIEVLQSCLVLTAE